MKLNSTLYFGLIASSALLFSQFAFNNLSQNNHNQQIELENFIFGGVSPSDAVPYVVGIENKTTGKICSGYRLEAKLVLTSAQCVDKRSNDNAIKVRVGNDIVTHFNEINVKSIYQSPNYVDPSGKKLAEYSESTNLAALILEDEISVDNEPNFPLFNDTEGNMTAMPVKLLGFGRSKIADPSSFGQIRYAGTATVRTTGNFIIFVKTPMVNGNDSSELESYNRQHNSNGGGICLGDEGGLVLRYDPTDKVTYFFGINSNLATHPQLLCGMGLATHSTAIRNFLNEFKSKYAKLLKNEGIEISIK